MSLVQVLVMLIEFPLLHLYSYNLGQQHTLSRGNSKRNNSLGGSPDGGDDYNFDLASDKKLSTSQVTFIYLIKNFT